MKRLSMMMILLLGSTMIAFAWNFSDITNENMVWDDFLVAPSPYASCAAWGDIDGDGAVDLFIGSQLGNHCQLYLNNGEGRFTDVSDEWGVDRFSNVKSAQFVDYDQDGLLDLFMITGNEMPLELYRQSAATRLTQIDFNLTPEEAANATSAVWGDLDRNGELDILVNAIGEARPQVTALEYENNAMTLARDAFFPEGIKNVHNLSMIDYNRDGMLDVFAGSSEDQSVFYLNGRDGYRDILNELGLELNAGACGIAWADFDHDSYLDFATCGSMSETYLYMGCVNNHHVVFEDVLRAPHSLVDPHPLMHYIAGATSVHAVDANMDGWTDLFYVNAAQGNFLLINDEGRGWTYNDQINRQLNDASRSATSAAWGDIDRDGDPDLVLTYDREGVVVLCNEIELDREYLSIRLVGSSTDTPMLNCQVIAKFDNSQGLWATTSMTNASVGSDEMVCKFVNPSTLHSRVLDLRVYWPTGTITTYTIDDIALWGETVIRAPRPTSDGGQDTDTFLEPHPQIMATLNNTPNPFNPTTTLNYTVPEAGWVELSVVNVLGQEVMSLVSGYSEAGAHSVHFNASALPSGMYIARMNVAGETMLHRMILTK